MSFYAEYLKEKTDDKIIETEFGFATYRHLPDQQATYIVDLYVLPDYRKEGYASRLADQICNEAKALGYTKIFGSVVPSNKNSTDSLRVLLGYKMTLKSSSNDFIFFERMI